MNDKISLLIVDDYPVVVDGLVAMCNRHPEIDLVGKTNNGAEAVKLALSLQPNVVLMNISMPEMDGIVATRLIKEAAPEINVLIFSGLSEYEQVSPALNAGAIGYILKDSTEPELFQAIQKVAQGEAWLDPAVIGHVLRQIREPEQKEEEDLINLLTERELEVLKLMGKGATNQEIAENMVVSPATIHSHVSHILSKLEVSSRTQAVIIAMRAGIIPEND